jgi:hypothetical protein
MLIILNPDYYGPNYCIDDQAFYQEIFHKKEYTLGDLITSDLYKNSMKHTDFIERTEYIIGNLL